jgi:hypothetical protein
MVSYALFSFSTPNQIQALDDNSLIRLGTVLKNRNASNLIAQGNEKINSQKR